MKKYRCTVLGATGLIGQQFMRMLLDHPNFIIEVVYASSRSVGKSFDDIWELPFFDFPENLRDIEIRDIASIDTDNPGFEIAFSGLPANIADELESDLRAAGVYVFTNSSPHRMDEDVPILIPEINEEHLELARLQKEKYGGFIIANANCSVTGASMYLGELAKIVDFSSVIVSTYQALSGAGITGVSSVRITDNIVPFIQNEEDKMRIEAQKILGKLVDGRIVDAEFELIANCARVNVIDGHTEAITVITDKKYEQSELIDRLSSIGSSLDLFSSPEKHVEYLNDADRPQPRKDRLRGKGMTTSIGRLRVQNNFISSYILVHNTIRGGAGGSVLNAELAISKGLI